ncbi:conserved hypothetical protein [Uncinocarpus reesii 1704]|uniref:Tyrosinase copper-binding domain-containing protein n=1 Tax=Uncinocarpus reesii (strain UAMH 1704) TaxID=336963 RepID=C4JN15_UNCRE|nr:uncharacterized protein UREG_04223 [Uncinocarpus reesii 1704]EEP79377.1 conserved hypothetical protein [Uncinocarpus reesii 1704]
MPKPPGVPFPQASVSTISMQSIACAKDRLFCPQSNIQVFGIEWMTLLRKDCAPFHKAAFLQTNRADLGLRYWNWALSANNLSASPLFDGSPTSFSGNGDPIDADPVIPLTPSNVSIPRGTGGGCVTNGPFANMILNLPDLDSAPNDVFPPNGFHYSPHCLTRDLNTFIARAFTGQADVDRLLASPDIATLQHNIDVSSWPAIREAGIMGPHAAAHMQLGRSMDDFWTAPQEPTFMLHHAMVDRIWALWQAQDPENRRWALNGTSTIMNAPSTPEVDLDTQLTWGWLSENKTLREIMSTKAYEYNYEYGD